MKLTEAQQNRIKRCVDNLSDEQTGMDKDQLFGFCTNLEKSGKLDETGHWGKDSAKFAEMIGVPVFKAGKYHDGKVTVTDTDLDEMAANFDATADAFKRPIKLTHKDATNDQNAAMGFIRRVYTAGVNGVKHLLADLSDVPDTLAKAIIDRRILDRSIEMYPTFQGKRNVLRALAFLGDDVPEVKGLPDLKNYVYGENEPEHVTYIFTEATPGGNGLKSQSTDSNNNEDKRMDPIKLTINGEVKEFADGAAVKAFFQTGLVPASEMDGLKSKLAVVEKRDRENSVKLAFAEFRKPNDKGKVLAPAVVDAAEKLAMQLPVEVKFSEGDKEITGIEYTAKLLKTFSETGLVDVRQDVAGKDTTTDNKDTGKDAELKANFDEGKAAGIIRADMTFDQFKAAQ